MTEKPEPLTSPSSLLVAAIVTAIGLNNDSFSIYVTLEICESIARVYLCMDSVELCHVKCRTNVRVK